MTHADRELLGWEYDAILESEDEEKTEALARAIAAWSGRKAALKAKQAEEKAGTLAALIGDDEKKVYHSRN
jgi:hypothetical protein